MRIGIGYDIHPLKIGEELILGGVKIENDLGLSGHSDGDVLIHSIIDSIFGSFGLSDIGNHFPDNDPQYRGMSSIILLKKTMDIITGHIINIDSTILCEQPRLSPYISKMKNNISSIVGINPSFISIKSTTGEGLGPVGEHKAIACFAVTLSEMLK